MRVAARTVFIFFCFVIALALFSPSANAQTLNPSPAITTQTTNTASDNFLFPNTAADVPRTHHMYTQIELIDILSAVMCQLTGIDPTNSSQQCLGVNPTNGQIGFSPSQSQQFAMASPTQPQLGGALGVMNQFIGSLYIPAISSTQYTGYLADNFGVTKTYAATDCNTSQFGYGFCGLSPILKLWSQVRDLAYAMLTILFVTIGIGVMFRFRVDPRTVMTLQNQIPRVIIAILLITFSYGIAGGMIDLMWTATYAGINFISSASPQSKIGICPPAPQPLNQVVETRLIDTPISFTNTLFRGDCNGTFDSGLLGVATKVSSSLGDLVQQIAHDLLFGNNSCHTNWLEWVTVIPGIIQGAKCALQSGALSIILWLAEFLVKIIIIVTILVALFRLWYKLIICYLTFLIFVILGPIWIVLGLIPGRPMGFEKWLRIIFANLAAFPLVAFVLVFGRVLSDLAQQPPTVLGASTSALAGHTGTVLGLTISPNFVFVPPLVGNPNLSTFVDLMIFGILMILPSIPEIIKERLKAKSQSNLGGAVGAAVAGGAGIAMAVPNQINKHLNKRDQYGNAIGALARGKDNAANAIATKVGNTPGLKWFGNQHRLSEAAKRGPEAYHTYREDQRGFKQAKKEARRSGNRQAFHERYGNDPTRWGNERRKQEQQQQSSIIGQPVPTAVPVRGPTSPLRPPATGGQQGAQGGSAPRGGPVRRVIKGIFRRNKP